jgi:hypothetical protein
MSTKSITLFASMVAVFATVTTAQAASKTGMNHPAATSQDASFQVAWNWPQPVRQPTAAVAAVRG